MDTLPVNFLKIFIVFVLFCFFGLGAGFIFLNSKIDAVSQTSIKTPIPLPLITPEPSVSPTASPSLSVTPFPSVNPTSTPTPAYTPKPTTVASGPKVTYIPLGIGGSTQLTDWTDVPDSQVYVSLTTEYGPAASVWWEALLKVENGSGTTYARLFDVTHGIAVDGSQIALSNIATPTLVEGGPLRFWAGRNLYKVQIKSLNSSTAYFDFGRIKISY